MKFLRLVDNIAAAILRAADEIMGPPDKPAVSSPDPAPAMTGPPPSIEPSVLAASIAAIQARLWAQEALEDDDAIAREAYAAWMRDARP